MHTTGVTILTTDLARTDRRALSEAWYSSLHLAKAAARGRTAAPGTPSTRAMREAHPIVAARGGGRLQTPPMHAACPSRTAGGRAERPPLERRVIVSPFARRIERAIAARAHRATASCVTIAGRAGRVLVMVRSDGARTRVIAICPQSLRDEVERALAHARFSLGVAGAVRIEAA